jgi:hypothetical protein
MVNLNIVTLNTKCKYKQWPFINHGRILINLEKIKHVLNFNATLFNNRCFILIIFIYQYFGLENCYSRAARRTSISFWFCLKGNVILRRIKRTIISKRIATIRPTGTLDKVMKLKTWTRTLLIIKKKEQLINLINE